MRGSIGRRLSLGNPINFSDATRQALLPFSTSSAAPGGGGGRGRGRGFGFSQIDFAAPGKPARDEPESKPEPAPPGLGHGRGRHIPSSSTLPPNISHFIPSIKPPPAGRGRVVLPQPDSASKQPIFFKEDKEDDGASHVSETRASSVDQDSPRTISVDQDSPRTSSVDQDSPRTSSVDQDSPRTSFADQESPLRMVPKLSGSGRGKPPKAPSPEAQAVEENRHLRASQRRATKMTREEALKNAVEILSRGGGGEGGGRDITGGGSGGRGFRGRGGSWGGRGRGMYGRRGRGEVSRNDGHGGGLYLGDNADGERLAKRLGPEIMNKLVEGFEEISGDVLPSPADDAILDAMDSNYRIECEQEYMMGEFDQNPDIDEKPPIPLRDAFEKMKPFLMVYEGIESQEEWEEIMKATMETVPLMKEIVDYYSGEDRVTAKEQQKELESVAKKVPVSAPDSVKRFTDRAVLSLQSNPGWRFDKKCQFMDKVVREVSLHYK